MSDKKIISLTFDDGPNLKITDQILDILEEYGARASFFLVGDHITPETEYLVHREVAMGCSIENHSKTHSYMTTLSDEEIISEIKYTSDKIEELTGERPKFFRPPYIDVDDRMYDLIDELTFISGFGSMDWIAEVNAKERAENILAAAKDGAIILVHDFVDNYNTAEAIKIVIPRLISEGYEFVTVREIFEAKDKAIDHSIMYSEF